MCMCVCFGGAICDLLKVSEEERFLDIFIAILALFMLNL